MAIAWQDTSRTIQRYQITPTLAIADGTLGCTGWCWSVLRDLEKGGVNRAVLGLWFPWTEVPETSQKNDISLTWRPQREPSEFDQYQRGRRIWSLWKKSRRKNSTLRAKRRSKR